jgi:hypothetical protein
MSGWYVKKRFKSPLETDTDLTSAQKGQDIVYTYSSMNPGSSASGASIVQPDPNSLGSTQMDLSQSIHTSSQTQP